MALTKDQANSILADEVLSATEASTEPSKLTKDQASNIIDSTNYQFGWGDAAGANPDDFNFNLKSGNFDNFL